MSTTNIKEPLTPKEIKGVTMTVKGLARKYDFITGWELIDGYRDWEGCLFLNLKVDPYKLGEYFNCNVKRYWDKSFRQDPQYYNGKDFLSLKVYLEEGCITYETAVSTTIQMEQTIQLFYNGLPDNYKKTYSNITSEIIRGRVYDEKPFISQYLLDLNNIPPSPHI